MSYGKIGSAAYAVRREVNQMIRDNRPQSEIIKYLADQGIDDVSPQNVTSWKNNGYRKWLTRQQRMDDMQSRMEWAQSLVADDAQPLSDLASKLVLNILLAALESYDPSTLNDAVAEKPLAILKIAEAVGDIRAGDQSAASLQARLSKLQRELEASAETGEEVDLSAVAKEMQRVLGM